MTGTRKGCFSRAIPVKFLKPQDTLGYTRTRPRDDTRLGPASSTTRTTRATEYRGQVIQRLGRIRYLGTITRGATPRENSGRGEAAGTHPSSVSWIGHDERSKRPCPSPPGCVKSVRAGMDSEETQLKTRLRSRLSL